MSKKRTYRKLSAKQKAEIVLAGLRGDRSVAEVCRAAEIIANPPGAPDQALHCEAPRAATGTASGAAPSPWSHT